jgi:hypothetical protein
MKEGTVISLIAAQLAKAKGFRWETLSYYYKNGDGNPVQNKIESTYGHYGEGYTVEYDDLLDSWNIFKSKYSAPTQPDLQKWLRDVHGLNIKIEDFIIYGEPNVIDWDYEVVKIGSDVNEVSSYFIPYAEERSFPTYEEALEEALIKSLELLDE